MNPDVFFENFELLADSPNGIKKLRELILQLAVMGELVEQDPSDEPASMLLEKIKTEKKKLNKEGKNGSKSMSAINVNQTPYEIPSSWEWTYLSECGLINPRNDISDEKEISFIPMTCISEKYGQNVEMEIKKWEEIKKGFTHFAENDVVLAKITPCFQNGKSAVMRGLKNGYGAGTTELHVFRPLKDLINPNYVLIYLKSPDFIYDGIPKMTGSAGQKRVPKDYFSENPFPLPPLSEQKRIVVKVDQMMALCNILETHRQKKNELQSKLNSAALDRMLSAENQEEFEQRWQQICGNFDLLYDIPENVEKLRQAILQLAVQGKLVEQNLEDEQSSILIEKIEAEKRNLVKQKKIKQIKVDSIDDDNLPFNLPKEWIWTRLGNLCLQVSDGPHFSPNYVSEKEGIPFLSARNIKIDRFELDSAKYISFEDHEEFCKRIKPEKGDILYTKGGTTGIAKVNDLDFEFSIWVHVAVLRLVKNFIDPYYLALTLNSPLCYEQSQKFTHGSSNKDLGLTRMINILLPLPPLAEQKRIVEKVEQVMGLCDELEAKIRKEREDSEKLMEAVVRGLLEGTVAGKSESEKLTLVQAAVIQSK